VKKSKVVEGKTIIFPSAVDYFVFTPDNALYPELVKVFGEKPKELRILIPLEDEEKWASQYYRAYSQTRGLLCKGTGETAIRMVDLRTGAMADHESKEVVMKEVRCQGRDCPDYEKTCREIMNLQFLLPEVPGLGIWQIDTSSTNSIKNINSTAELVRRIHGHISMIPLLLTIEPIEAPDPKGIKRKVNVLNLRTNRTLIEMAEDITKPTPEMLAIELPIADDETPEMIIPQNQEEKVIPPAATTPPDAKPKAKETKGKPGVKGQPPKALSPGGKTQSDDKGGTVDPEATQEEKREMVKALRDKSKTNEQISEFFVSVTGKKGGWLHSDIEKLRAALKKPENKPGSEDEIDRFLAEFE